MYLSINVLLYSQANNEKGYLAFTLDDSYIIDSIKNKYIFGEYKMLVFQTKMEVKNDTIKDSCISSIIIINLNEKSEYWCIIPNEKIYQGELSNNSIFSFKNYRDTGAIRKENFIDFNKVDEEYIIKEEDSPFPFSILRCNNVIAYEDNKIRFYFEKGDEIYTYNPILKRQKYRQEWAELIQKELAPIIVKYCK